MPAIIDLLRTDLAYAFSDTDWPTAPMVRGHAGTVLDWIECHVPIGGPLFDRMWVGETPILRPWPGQILFALELGESIEVALSTDAVPFVRLYMCQEAAEALNVPCTDSVTLQAEEMLRLAEHLWQPHVAAFLQTNPTVTLHLSRPPDHDYGGGHWRVRCE